MSTLSNVISTAISAVFYAFLGGIFATSLIFFFYLDEKFLGVLTLTVLAAFVYVSFNLANIRFKAEIADLMATLFKLVFASVLSFLACYAAQYTYDLAIHKAASYGFLCFFASVFMLSQLFSVYIHMTVANQKFKNLTMLMSKAEY